MHAQGEIVGSTGYIDVEFNLPQEDVLIYGLQFSYTLPYGVQLLGGPENTIGNGWELYHNNGQIHLYNHTTPLNNIASVFGTTYSIVRLPVAVVADIPPGRLGFTATLTSVAIGNTGSQYGFSEGIDYCDT